MMDSVVHTLRVINFERVDFGFAASLLRCEH